MDTRLVLQSHVNTQNTTNLMDIWTQLLHTRGQQALWDELLLFWKLWELETIGYFAPLSSPLILLHQTF